MRGESPRRLQNCKFAVVGRRGGWGKDEVRSIGSLWTWGFDALHGLGANRGIAVEGLPLARYGFPSHNALREVYRSVFFSYVYRGTLASRARRSLNRGKRRLL
jgi:hypothetical protein